MRTLWRNGNAFSPARTFCSKQILAVVLIDSVLNLFGVFFFFLAIRILLPRLHEESIPLAGPRL